MKKYSLCQVVLLLLFVFIGVCVRVDASSMPSWNAACVSDCIAYSGSGSVIAANCNTCCNDTNNLNGNYFNDYCGSVSAYGNTTEYSTGNGQCSVSCNAVVSQPPASDTTCTWNPGQLNNTFNCD